ncbi:MAG: hypothetical protein QOE80_945 [Actinomycetota bacterium]|jgi:hypothetical protein|nr:hypothetical protein [Actinomycetota bacterium]
MRREEHVLGETFAYRFEGERADHALLILHGIASHGGIYDTYCAYEPRRAGRSEQRERQPHGDQT